jgi:hypothetical protein
MRSSINDVMVLGEVRGQGLFDVSTRDIVIKSVTRGVCVKKWQNWFLTFFCSMDLPKTQKNFHGPTKCE